MLKRNAKALEMLRCSHCGDLREALPGASTYCGDCRDDSRRSVLICYRCEEREVKDDSAFCAECEQAEAEARAER